jgi:membrane protease YdiL (CAAX protease family)
METANTISSQAADWRNARWITALELALGTFIVIAHNVYRIIPSEVILLFVIGMVSVRLRDGTLREVGLQIPSSWLRVVGIATAAAAARILIGEMVIDPMTARFWPAAVAPSGIDKIDGNIGQALKWLAIVWTYAAIGEEFVYRGYLLTRFAALANRSTAAYFLSVIPTSILFGYGHYYKGPAGIIDSGFAGFVLGASYLLSGRNLWAPILAHGLIDTLGITMLFFGLDS